MRELSLHILDIAQNSIVAEASFIEIEVVEDAIQDLFTIGIIDNGKGMDESFLQKVADPFVTTRQTRKVGLGISLFKAAAEMCNGRFTIQSTVGKGTIVTAQFQRSHIDRVPLGNMAETMMTLIMANEQIDYMYKHTLNKKVFIFDTRELRKVLENVSLGEFEVLAWIKSYIEEGIGELKGCALE
jgi:nitrogen fixation/metabolism regulation signal transduction histidine kinase